MGIVFRQSVKASISTLVGAVLGALTLYWQPKFFSAQEMGFSRYLITWGVLGQYFVLLGGQVTIVTFLPRYNDEDKRRKALLGAAFLVPVITCAVLTIPLLLLKSQILGYFKPQDIPYINRYFAALPVMVLIWSLMTVTDAYLTTKMKVAASAFIKDVVLRVGNIALIFLFAVGWINFTTYIIALVLNYLLPTLAMMWIANSTKGFRFSFRFSHFTRVEWKEILRFAQYHLLAGLALNLVGYVDMLMLPALDRSGLKSLAAYSIAVFIATMLTLPYKAMSTAAFPSLNEAYISGDTLRLNDLFRRSGINILVVSACMVALIVCNLTAVVSFLPKGYEAVIPLTLILLIGRIMDVATGMNTELITISVHYRFFFRLSVSLLVILIVLCRLLIPGYGVYGAAWSATISLLLFNLAKMVFLWVKFRLHPFSKGSIFIMLAAAVSGGVGYFLPALRATIPDLLLRTAVIVVVYILMLVWLKPSDDLQVYIQSIRKNKRLF